MCAGDVGLGSDRPAVQVSLLPAPVLLTALKAAKCLADASKT